MHEIEHQRRWMVPTILAPMIRFAHQVEIHIKRRWRCLVSPAGVQRSWASRLTVNLPPTLERRGSCDSTFLLPRASEHGWRSAGRLDHQGGWPDLTPPTTMLPPTGVTCAQAHRRPSQPAACPAASLSRPDIRSAPARIASLHVVEADPGRVFHRLDPVQQPGLRGAAALPAATLSMVRGPRRPVSAVVRSTRDAPVATLRGEPGSRSSMPRLLRAAAPSTRWRLCCVAGDQAVRLDKGRWSAGAHQHKSRLPIDRERGASSNRYRKIHPEGPRSFVCFPRAERAGQ